jgi:hypothetical protein
MTWHSVWASKIRQTRYNRNFINSWNILVQHSLLILLFWRKSRGFFVLSLPPSPIVVHGLWSYHTSERYWPDWGGRCSDNTLELYRELLGIYAETDHRTSIFPASVPVIPQSLPLRCFQICDRSFYSWTLYCLAAQATFPDEVKATVSELEQISQFVR